MALGWACAPVAEPSSAPSVTAPASVDEPLLGFVLLRPDARVRIAPNETAQSSPLRPPDAAEHLQPQRNLVVVRATRRRGDYYGILSGPQNYESTGCHAGHSSLLRGVDVSLWVHRDELQPVLTERFRARFGTMWVELWPGLPVSSSPEPSDERVEVTTDTMTITVPIAADSIGWVYRPIYSSVGEVQRFVDPDCGDACDLPGNDEVSVTLHKHTRARRVMDTQVELRAPCARVRGETEGVEYSVAPPLIGKGTTCGGFGPRDLVAHAHTPIWFSDGTPAGDVGAHRLLLHDHRRRTEGSRFCFDFDPRGRTVCQHTAESAITLCFDPEDLHSLRSPP
ncbi:MAG: hypothetical protein AAF799_02695 [Myxococcota bacterium]